MPPRNRCRKGWPVARDIVVLSARRPETEDLRAALHASLGEVTTRDPGGSQFVVQDAGQRELFAVDAPLLVAAGGELTRLLGDAVRLGEPAWWTALRFPPDDAAGDAAARFAATLAGSVDGEVWLGFGHIALPPAPLRADPDEVSTVGRPAPLLDAIGAHAVVVDDERPIVPLDRWLTAALTAAAADGRQLILRTFADARVTLPVLDLAGAGGLHWVVRDEHGVTADGLTGAPLLLRDGRYQPSGPPAQGRTAVPGGPDVPESGWVTVEATALHPPGDELRLGVALETAVLALTGRKPTGWGTAEPASERWRPATLTRFVRERSEGSDPAGSRLVVVGRSADEVEGRRAVAVLTVERRPSGVAERFHVRANLPGPPDPAVLDTVAHDLAAHDLRTAVLALQPGFPDLTSGAAFPPAVPLRLLLGPEAAADLERSNLPPDHTAHRGPRTTLVLRRDDNRPLDLSGLLARLRRA